VPGSAPETPPTQPAPPWANAAPQPSATQPAPPWANAAQQAPAAEPAPPWATAVPTGPRGRRVRRRWLAVLLALLAIVAIAAVEVPQFLSPAPTETIWQKITSGITDPDVPKQTALEAFAYVYKVDIPDVVVPSGVDGADAPVSGSGAMRWVQADWSQLSAAQQAVIDRYLPPETTKGTHQMTPAPSAARFAPGVAPAFAPGLAPANGGVAVGRSLVDRSNASAQQPHLDVNPPIGWPFTTNVAPDASVDLAFAMADDMASIIVGMGPKLGVPVIYPGPRDTPDIILTLSDTDGGTALLDTRPTVWDNGHYSPCDVTAYKNTWSNAAWTAGDKVSPTLHVLLAHEVVHCYQNAVIGDIYRDAGMPSWTIEGTADYLAVNYTGIVGPGDAGAWQDYLIPEISLTTRSYDAMGYFAELAFKGRDLWGKMATAWRAAGLANSYQHSDAFIAVLNGDDSDIRDNWAETYANATAWQDPWILHGLGAPVDKSAALHDVQAIAAPGWTGSLYSRSNTLLYVKETSGEVVTIVTDNGLASVHDSSGHSSIAFQDQSFCTVESCVCPPGTALAGQDVAPAHISIPFITAVNAPEGGANWWVIGTSLDDICKQKATPAPKQMNGPCGSVACPNSNGDPHILTINNYRYDFQAAGEFTLLQSPDGSVDIQSRQEPYASSVTPKTISVNTAIAAKVGSHRVGVYVTSTGLAAHVDGKTVDLSGGPMDLGGGGKIATYPKGFEIDFPDGTTMWVLAVGQWGINAQIRPSASLRADGVGLLGSITPGGLGVPALPDGTRLPKASDNAHARTIVYSQFADAWRLTDSTTLFDYDPGKSTETYTIRPYPTNTVVASVSDLSPSQASTGDAACTDVTDPALHDECVYDVGVTGDSGFAQSYTYLQGFYDNGPSVIAPTSSSPAASLAPPTPAAGAVSGAMTVAQNASVGGFAIGSDNTVYMTVQTGQTSFSLMAIDPVGQKIVNQVSVPALTPVHFAAGSVWLPGLIADANGHNCSVTRFDAQTLAQGPTIATPCSAFGAVGLMASDGSAVWFEDDKIGTGSPVLTEIDPTTNAPGASVPLPFGGGYEFDSQGALIYYGTGSNQGYYRLTTGATAFEQLSTYLPGSPPRPGGAGLWFGSQDGKTATYYSQAGGTPTATVQVDGEPVAGDGSAVYVETQGTDASGNFNEQLWRCPIDGSSPTEIATAPTIDGNPLSYFGDPMPISNGHGVLKVWTTRTGSQQVLTVLLQWTPTP
jgi:hypothetical protein